MSKNTMTIEERIENHRKQFKIAEALASLITDIKGGMRWTMNHDEETDTWVAPSEDEYTYPEYMARQKAIELIESEIERML